MDNSVRAIRYSFIIIVTIASATLLMDCSTALELTEDTSLSGTFSDQTIDAWGNITVPEDGHLELRNVTLVFHTDDVDSLGIRAFPGSTIVLSDGDNDPGTETDATNVTSTGGPWFLIVENATRFEIRNSILQNIGKWVYDPILGSCWQTLIEASSISITWSRMENLSLAMVLEADDIYLSKSAITSDLPDRYMRLNLVSTTIEVRDSTISIAYVSLLTEEKLVVRNSHIQITYYYLNIKGVTVELLDTWFDGFGVDIRSADTNSESSATVSRCKFTSGYPLHSRLNTLRVQECEFMGPFSGIVSHSPPNVEISNCTFTQDSRGINVQNAKDLKVTDVNFTGCSSPMKVTRHSGTVVLERLTVVNCRFGLYIEGSTEWQPPFTVNISECRFENINGKGLSVIEVTALSVCDSTFLNLHMGIEGSSSAGDLLKGMTVINCSFRNCTIGIKCLEGDLRVMACSFEGEVLDPASTAITVRNDGNHLAQEIYLRNISVAGKGAAIDLRFWSRTLVIATLRCIIISECDFGIRVNGLTRCNLEDVTTTDCTTGMSLISAVYINAYGLEMANLTNGLTVSSSHEVKLEDIQFQDIKEWAIREEDIDGGRWSITRDTDVVDQRLWIAGMVVVTASVRLIDTQFEIRGSSSELDGFAVEDGGALFIQRSTLNGDALHPFVFKVEEGSALAVMDSTIVHCGQDRHNITRTGLYLKGTSHRLENVTMRGGTNGLVLDGCQVFIDGCDIRVNATGLLASGSEVTMDRSHIHSNLTVIESTDGSATVHDSLLNSTYSVFNITNSHIEVTNTTIHAGHFAIELNNSTAMLEKCDVLADRDLFNVRGSILELWYMDLASLRGKGGTVDDGKVAMYDTVFGGDWNLVGDNAEVTETWHYDISAFYRWNGEPATGLDVLVGQEQGSGGSSECSRIDANGTMSRVWLMGTKRVPMGILRYSPYRASIVSGDLRAQSTLPEDTWAEVVLDVVDVASPLIVFEKPSNGTVLTNYTVVFQGSVHDLTSGINVSQYSLEGNIWEPLELAEDGRWELRLEVAQGRQTLRVRASDLDGNQVISEAWVVVDLADPLVIFTSPESMTAFLEDQIILEGLVVLDEGTAIVMFTVDGIDVELEIDGAFHVEVALSDEGETTFIAEAHDLAGNVGSAMITIVKDTTPPVLMIDDIPLYSREWEITVTGRVGDHIETELTLNGMLIGYLVNDTFQVNVSLVMGKNTLLVEAVDALGNRAWSEHLVVLDSLINGTIVRPRDGEVVREPDLHVIVDTDPGTWVRLVDHTDWTLTGNGTLDLQVELAHDWETVILVEFRDIANNTLEDMVTVTYIEKDEGTGLVLFGWPLAILCSLVVLAILTWWALRKRPGRGH